MVPLLAIIGAMKRIINTGTIKYLNKEIKVCGWADSIRSHGKIIFIDLRDRSGILQLVFTPENEEIYKEEATNE